MGCVNSKKSAENPNVTSWDVIVLNDDGDMTGVLVIDNSHQVADDNSTLIITFVEDSMKLNYPMNKSNKLLEGEEYFILQHSTGAIKFKLLDETKKENLLKLFT